MSDLSSENIDSMQKITRRKSAMRQATFEGTENASHPAKNEDERKLRIVSRRGVFKWLHVAFSSDLVYGSWYAKTFFLKSSLLTHNYLIIGIMLLDLSSQRLFLVFL
jgi:hypothetical protein